MGARIKTVRRNAGMSQEEFARTLGYSKRALINWETGVADPSVAVLPHLRRTYNVDLEWLIMGDGTNPDPIGTKRSRSRDTLLEPNPGQLWLFEEVSDGATPEDAPPALPSMLNGVVHHMAPLT